MEEGETMIKQAIEALSKIGEGLPLGESPALFARKTLTTLRAHQANLEKAGKERPKQSDFSEGGDCFSWGSYINALESYCDTQAVERVEIVRKARLEGIKRMMPMPVNETAKKYFEEVAESIVAAMPLEVKE